MTSNELRKMAEKLRKKSAVNKTLKTAQVLEALSGLERLQRKINR